ncbi:MAG: arsenosugar biosynthesis radical SAM (seleno)protein ArsS [Thermodesulfovibrionales bacterium]
MTISWATENLTKIKVETVQINLGNRCNQRCLHCHIGASPEGNKNMDHETSKKVLEKLIALKPSIVEFTGGAPEMNPNLAIFIEELFKNNIRTVVRTNLTVLEMDSYSSYIDLYSKYGVRIIASLPGYSKEETDRQRGKGTFEKSIRILKELNRVGYGDNGLILDIVHNPPEVSLPRSQEELEREYREVLKKEYGIRFNGLITITNSPIGSFKRYLINHGKYEDYIRLLVNNFNAETLNRLMCRNLISVDYEGYVYDCDFNLSLGVRIKGYEDIKFWEIDFEDFNPPISCGEHCYACTAAMGSSCSGSLINTTTHDVVKRYYGQVLKGKKDLKTKACCIPDDLPESIKEVLPLIADEIKEKYYGCGSPIPLELTGLKVLDLGCGTGRDCYILSKLVGEEGFVYGMDMTEEQIDIAIKYIEEHMKKFGYKKPNVRFIHDYVENLDKHFQKNSLDLVISNCVVNLIEDKEGVIQKVYKILKDGGEFYFSDIYADRRLPEEIRKDPVLYSECLGGALYWKDFERIAKLAGFVDPRIVSNRVVEIKNDEIRRLVENVTFYSITYRLWKIEGLEDGCEDYGHVALYRGGVKESPFKFMLDFDHIFEKDRPERVCGNTALMLSKTRVKKYFHISGNFEKHFGPFNCCGNRTKEGINKTSEIASCC